ncbi:MAG: hypothetical protein V4718_08345 [Pseudomonadota bacterium]
MTIKNLVCVSLLAFVAPVFSADAPAGLPSKMQGKWGSKGNMAEVELLEMASPTQARLKVVFWDGCTRRGETSAELIDGVLTFVAPGGARCENISVKMTKVADKNRFEGDFETNNKGAVTGKVFLEW